MFCGVFIRGFKRGTIERADYYIKLHDNRQKAC
jgi:hypothetical protein